MNALPFFEVEAIISVINTRNAMDQAHPLFGLFRPQGQRAAKIKLRTLIRRPGQVRHTTWGGRAVPVTRGTQSERLLEPAVLKVFDHFTFEDVLLFQQAEDAMQQAANTIEGGAAPAVVEATDRIRRMGADLGDDLDEETHRLMVGACLGTVDVLIYDADEAVTVDYGLTEIASPTIPWDDEDAIIVSDMTDALETFRNNNPRGLSATHLLYNPAMSGATFLKNTQWLALAEKNEQMVEGLLRVPGGKNPFDMDGTVNTGLFGLVWVKVQGTYMAQDGAGVFTSTDRWPANVIVLLNLPNAGPRWQMVLHPWMNPRANVNVEVKLPQEGDDVKDVTVTAFWNGLPIWEDPTLVQPWEVYTL